MGCAFIRKEYINMIYCIFCYILHCRMAEGIVNGVDLNKFKVFELKEWLKDRGVKTSRKKKAELIKR